MNKEILEHSLTFNRRKFLSRLSLGIGSVALGSLLIPDLFNSSSDEEMLMTGLPHLQVYHFYCSATHICQLFYDRERIQ